MNGKIRIQRKPDALSPHSKFYEVFLDDVNVSKFVRAISIKIEAGGIPSVLVELVGIVELPDEIEAVVDVYRDKEAE